MKLSWLHSIEVVDCNRINGFLIKRKTECLFPTIIMNKIKNNQTRIEVYITFK